ncbi:MAG: hypothetical protein U9Q08_03960 [Candidatus Omnitrophota bacterium]|nr:hypothetical protein [Candidatus Omnitrophota bacterium]
MVTLVRLFGVVMVACGVIFLISPDLMKKYIDFWTGARGIKRIYAGGVLSLLIGIFMLFAASECSVPEFVIFIGIWGIVKGIVLFILGGLKKLAPIFNWYTTRKLVVLRIMAFLVLTLGTLLICSA